MSPQNLAPCNVCKSSVAPDALFCTTCGTRLPEPQPATETQAVVDEKGKPPDVPRCIKCNAVLESQALFCTGCGARVNAAELAVPDTVPSERAAVISQSAAAPAMAATNSASAGSASADPAAQPEGTDISTGLGQSSSALKPGIFVVIALVLIVGVAAVMLWMRPSSAAQSNHVIILAPQSTSFTVEPNSSTQVTVSVQGDGGAGLSWKIAETYGGTVQPAGVTVRGSQFLYHGTYHAGGTPGDYHIVASSAANPESRVTILVHVER
jgi:hypothetical protein